MVKKGLYQNENLQPTVCYEIKILYIRSPLFERSNQLSTSVFECKQQQNEFKKKYFPLTLLTFRGHSPSGDDKKET